MGLLSLASMMVTSTITWVANKLSQAVIFSTYRSCFSLSSGRFTDNIHTPCTEVSANTPPRFPPGPRKPPPQTKKYICNLYNHSNKNDSVKGQIVPPMGRCGSGEPLFSPGKSTELVLQTAITYGSYLTGMKTYRHTGS